MYFTFLSDGGAPNVAGPGVTYPLRHPLDGPEYQCIELELSFELKIKTRLNRVWNLFQVSTDGHASLTWILNCWNFVEKNVF